MSLHNSFSSCYDSINIVFNLMRIDSGRKEFDIPHIVVQYRMKNTTYDKRKFISIYFQNGRTKSRKKRDVTVAFNKDDPLYEKSKKLGSSGIKELIGVNSYQDLVALAKKEERTVSNFIKYRLKKKIRHK